jgi:hypothetical protein
MVFLFGSLQTKLSETLSSSISNERLSEYELSFNHGLGTGINRNYLRQTFRVFEGESRMRVCVMPMAQCRPMML